MTLSLPELTTIAVTEPDEGIALVTLDRPERLNAITSTMNTELEAVVAAVDLDPALRAVIITGAGRGFSAGLDLQEQGHAPGADAVRPLVSGFMWQDHLATLHEKIQRSRKPWIAAINGPCVGGGFAMTGPLGPMRLGTALELRLSPTMRLASPARRVCGAVLVEETVDPIANDMYLNIDRNTDDQPPESSWPRRPFTNTRRPAALVGLRG